MTWPLIGAETQLQIVRCSAEDVVIAAGPIINNHRKFSRLLGSSSSYSSSSPASLVAWVYSNLIGIHRHFFTSKNCGYRATFMQSLVEQQSPIKDVRLHYYFKIN